MPQKKIQDGHWLKTTYTPGFLADRVYVCECEYEAESRNSLESHINWYKANQ